MTKSQQLELHHYLLLIIVILLGFLLFFILTDQEVATQVPNPKSSSSIPIGNGPFQNPSSIQGPNQQLSPQNAAAISPNNLDKLKIRTE